MGYRTIRDEVTATTQVNRSRFVAVLRRVDDAEQARAVIADQRAAHPDAGHHCSAYLIGPDGLPRHSSDDGEPSGTAGAPMLACLQAARVSDVVAVVSRWFGGTLLGTGGLARAYGAAVQAALDDAALVRRAELDQVAVVVDHAQAGRLEAELRARGVMVTGTDYGARATLHLRTADPAGLTATIASLTAGTAHGTPEGRIWCDLEDR